MKTLIATVISSFVFFGVQTHMEAAQASADTLRNLNAAYAGESNAAHRYELFAKKADQEGHPQVAKLFRAASLSESIHRDNHKEAIEKLGGKVDEIKLEEVNPGTTAENLAAAIKGEKYEVESMYPQFLEKAKAEDAKPAVRTLQFALATEKEHAKLYQQALDTLGKNVPTDYFVCKVCGNTMTQLPEKRCPVCHNPRDKFTKVS